MYPLKPTRHIRLSATMHLLRYNEYMIKYAKTTISRTLYLNKDKAAIYEQ